MSFQSYCGTAFEPWLLPIIPADAKLSEASTISLDKLGKIPGLYKPGTGDWRGFADWTARPLPHNKARQILAIWDNWYPKGHQTIGLKSRHFPGIDLDVNTAEQALIAKNLAFEIVGATVMRGRSDGSPRLLLPYRFSDGTQPITKMRQSYEDDSGEFAIEILGRGRHYLIEGDHPKGGTYVWSSDADPTHYHSMMELPGFGAEQLPEITFEQCLQFLNELKEQYEVSIRFQP